MDGFDQDEAAGERNERGVVLGSFFAPERNALEPLELANRLLDPSAALIEDLGEEGRAIFGIGAARDDRANVPLPRGLTVRRCILPLVGQRRRNDLGTPSKIKSERRATSSRNPWRLAPESAGFTDLTRRAGRGLDSIIL